MSDRTEVNQMNEQLPEYLLSKIIKHKKSLWAAAARIKKILEHAFCTKTINNLIDHGLILGESKESLKKKHKRRKAARRCAAIGVNNRTNWIAASKASQNRQEVGHWEITISSSDKKGKESTALLALTERKTRKEITYKIKKEPEGSFPSHQRDSATNGQEPSTRP